MKAFHAVSCCEVSKTIYVDPDRCTMYTVRHVMEDDGLRIVSTLSSGEKPVVGLFCTLGEACAKTVGKCVPIV